MSLPLDKPGTDLANSSESKVLTLDAASAPPKDRPDRSKRGRTRMMNNFRIGDKVVYPNHGVGTIEQISSRTTAGTAEHYYLLRINSNSLTVMVPFNNVDSVGLRKIVKQAEIGKILVYLADGDCHSHADWKWRFKENSEKMRSGSLLQVAEVMKSLLKLSRGKPLSFREKKMLDRSRYLLVSELATVKGMPEKTAETLIDKSLAKSKLKLPDID